MNIFVLDTDPELAAIYHCDKHVVKMITEYSQILSTVHFLYRSEKEILFKPCYIKHPCVVWTRQSPANYLWLRTLLQQFCQKAQFLKTGMNGREFLKKLSNPLCYNIIKAFKRILKCQQL